MAIGKVGSFATVEPALVDFGSMVERNIDKIKADEAAKAAAKAAVEKAKSDALKDVKDVDAFKLSGVTGYDQTLSGTVNGMYQKFLDAKEAYLSTGDRSYLLVADKIRNEVATINNESEAMAGVLTKFAELSKTGKINSEIADEKLLELQAIKDEKVKYSFEDGKTMMTFTDEDGNITNKVPASGYVTNMLGDMPESFKLNDEIKGIVETVKASEIEAGGASYRKTVTDINSPDSEPQRKRLDNAAKYFSEQNNSMASWYQSKRKEEKAKGNVLPLKTSGWTEDEKAEAKKFFYDQMINSYQKKVSIDAKEPSGGSGSGDKKTFAATEFDASKKYKLEGATGKGLSWSGDVKESPILGSFMIQRTEGDKKTNLQINNATLKNIFVNKDGNVIMAYDEQVGNLSEREVQEKMSALDAIISGSNIASEVEKAKKEKETLKTQSSKVKSTNILTIRRSDEDLLGMIANSMGLSSTSQLLGQLDELAGRNDKQKETAAERARRIAGGNN
jgi:hypothetical protein